MMQTLWLASIGVCLVVGSTGLVRSSAHRMLGLMLAASLLIPTWIELDVAGLPFNVRTTVAAIGLILVLLDPRARFRSPIGWLDVWMTALVLVHVASESMLAPVTVLTGLRAYGEWALPYVAGRFAIRSEQDEMVFTRAICVVGLILGLGAIAETLSGQNPFEWVFGVRPEDGASRTMERFGFKRAYGVTMHPIFLGMLLLCLVPWAVQMLWTRRPRLDFGLAVTGLAAMTGGIVATFSRGALLGLVCGVALIAATRSRVVRWLSLGCMATAITLLVWEPPWLIDALERSGGHDPSITTTVKIGDEELRHSGTLNRLNLLRAYWPAVTHAGLLGYGTERTATFPPDIPYLPNSARTRREMRYVDNSYLLITLRFGYLGCAAFTGLLLCAIWQTARVAGGPVWPAQRALLLSLAGGVTAMAIGILTVFLAYDFVFVLLMTLGVCQSRLIAASPHPWSRPELTAR